MEQMCPQVCFPDRAALAASWNKRVMASAEAGGRDALFYAAEAARESIVLMKNDGVLPFARSEAICVAGERAVHPRFCARGEGVLFASPYEEMCERAGRTLPYARTRSQAAALARDCTAAVLFLAEENGRFPAADVQLLRAFRAAGVRTVAVLQGEGSAPIPFFGECAAAVQTFLAGSGGALAVSEILYGLTAPSGLLAQCPRGVPAGAFGCGLSYTRFACHSLRTFVQGGGAEVTFTVKNCGQRDGKAVLRIYCEQEKGDARLAWFEKVFLRLGEEKRIRANIPVSDGQDAALQPCRIRVFAMEQEQPMPL